MKIKTKMKNNSIALNVSPNPADLKTHENQDQNEKPFSCTQCHMNLTNPANLRINENQDRHRKPFSCSQCNSKSANLLI